MKISETTYQKIKYGIFSGSLFALLTALIDFLINNDFIFVKFIVNLLIFGFIIGFTYSKPISKNINNNKD